MTALSAANDTAAVSFATVGEQMAANGLEFFTFDEASKQFVSNMAELAPVADVAAASLATVGDAAATDIPSVETLNAQFASMQANLATSFAAIDAESAAMIANAEAASTDAAASEAFSAALASVGEVAGSVAAVLGTIALVAGAVAAVIGAVSVKMAGDFQAGITTLETGAGELDKNLGMVSAGMLQMAVDTGTSTQQLTAGMYMIESAGFHGADGLKVLQAAAEGAKVGVAALGDVANGVTTEMTDYHLGADQAAYATNILIEAVKLGKSHMQDMAQALATVLPAASVAGIGLNDVMAAMATMTAAGTPAAQAATYLRQTILALEAPSKGAAKMLAEVGLTTQQVATEMKKSLPDALQMITDAIAKKFPPGSAAYIAALKSIVGGTKQLQGILELTGGNLKTFQANVAGINDAVQKGGKGIAGWSKVQGDFNTQLARAGEVLQTGLIKLGLQLLPIITPLIKGFADWASNGKAVSKTFADIGHAVAPVFAALVPMGNFLKATFKPVWDQLMVTLKLLKPQWDQMVAAIAPAMPMFKILGEIIGAVVVLALMLFIKSVALAAQGAVVAFGLIALAVMASVRVFLGGMAAIGAIITWLTGRWQWLKSQTVSIWNGMISWLKTAWGNLVASAFKMGSDFITFILNGLKSAWKAVVDWVTQALNWLKSLWPHSPVKEGPLKGSEKWGYNFMKNIADGMRAGFPQVQSAMNALLLPMGRSFNLGISSSGYRYPAMGGASQPVIVQIPQGAFVLEVDGRRFTNEVVGPHLAQAYVIQNGIRGIY